MKKLPEHDAGQVTFHSENLCRYFVAERRLNDIINRLNKTKREETVDWQKEHERRDFQEKQARQAAYHKAKEEAERVAKEKEIAKSNASYATVMQPDKMTSNKSLQGASSRDYEENFF